MNMERLEIGTMSELGQFQKSARANAMSAFPVSDQKRTSLAVRFVPITARSRLFNSTLLIVDPAAINAGFDLRRYSSQSFA
jgi:hypothetical protein